MDQLAEEFHKHLNTGAAINISGFFREFENQSLTSNLSQNSVILHLFSCYLTNQLNHAKLLWKRTPVSLKNSSELDKTWEIGKDLFKKDYSKALSLLNSFHWIVAEDIAKLLRNKIIEDTKHRIAKIYVSIEVHEVETLLAMNSEKTVELVNKWGWQIRDNFVYPTVLQTEYVKKVDENDVFLVTQLVDYLEQKYHLGIDN